MQWSAGLQPPQAACGVRHEQAGPGGGAGGPGGGAGGPGGGGGGPGGGAGGPQVQVRASAVHAASVFAASHAVL